MLLGFPKKKKTTKNHQNTVGDGCTPRGTPRSGQGRAPPGKCWRFSNFCCLRCPGRPARPACAPLRRAAAAGFAGGSGGAGRRAARRAGASGGSRGRAGWDARGGVTRAFPVPLARDPLPPWGSGGPASSGVRAEMRVHSVPRGFLPQLARDAGGRAGRDADVCLPCSRCRRALAGPLVPRRLSGEDLWSSVTCPGNF